MDLFLTQWLLLVAIFSVTVVSPGPDFVMALQNSLAHGRRAGVMTAIGFGAGVCVHLIYTLVGLAALIASSVLLFSVVKYIGAAYLFYVGYKALRSQGWQGNDVVTNIQVLTKSDFSAIRDGFITNVFNPKATLFFLALFTQFLYPGITIVEQVIFGATCVFMVTGWFSVVAIFMTVPQVRVQFARISRWIDRICGVLFIALGIKLLTSRLST